MPGGASAATAAGWRSPDLEIRVGVSACLLGETVRYDGGHKRDAFVTDTLGRYVTWVPVCPEVEIGLGTPREAIRLQGDPAAPRLVGTKTGVDLTRRMTDYARGRVRALADLGLSGYVLKRASPSCGMERVKVYSDDGTPGRMGRGLFASALMERAPAPAGRGGRTPDGPAPPRELHHARVRPPPSRGPPGGGRPGAAIWSRSTRRTSTCSSLTVRATMRRSVDWWPGGHAARGRDGSTPTRSSS